MGIYGPKKEQNRRVYGRGALGHPFFYLTILLDEVIEVLRLSLHVPDPYVEHFSPLWRESIHTPGRARPLRDPLRRYKTILFELAQMTIDHPRRRLALQKTKALDILNQFIPVGRSKI